MNDVYSVIIMGMGILLFTHVLKFLFTDIVNFKIKIVHFIVFIAKEVKTVK